MLTDIRLQNFRSYTDAAFEFTNGVNIIMGPNASGKTNLIEAILMLTKGNSYRAKDADLVMFKKKWARLDGNNTDNSSRTLKIIIDPEQSKQFEIDGKVYKRLNIDKTYPIVLFEPNHLLLFTGGPEKRREYLDDILEQTINGYKKTRQDYKKTLAQRNNLLKRDGNISEEHFFPWDVRISQLAGQIVKERHDLLKTLNVDLENLYQELSEDKKSVRLQYESKHSIESYESELLKKLVLSRDLDKLRGYTGNGPHREDVVAFLDNHPIQLVSSRGESRTIILALKLLELKLLEKIREGTPPLLILDDVFSELDGKRRRMLLNNINKYQTFITTTDADSIISHFNNEVNLISTS